MIDVRVEQLITFNKAAEFLPEGRRPDYSTWWRWYRRGWRGIRLETVRFGNRRLTSVEAVLRFIAATTALDEPVMKPAATLQATSDSTDFLRRAGILTSATLPQQAAPPGGDTAPRPSLPART